jgi:hypothetical protein
VRFYGWARVTLRLVAWNPDRAIKPFLIPAPAGGITAAGDSSSTWEARRGPVSHRSAERTKSTTTFFGPTPKET